MYKRISDKFPIIQSQLSYIVKWKRLPRYHEVNMSQLISIHNQILFIWAVRAPNHSNVLSHCYDMAFTLWPSDIKCQEGSFTNVSRGLQNFLSKLLYCKNRTFPENCKLKLCMCGKRHAMGTRTKFHLDVCIINVISGIVYFREIILEGSRDVSETTQESGVCFATIIRRCCQFSAMGVRHSSESYASFNHRL